MHPHRYKWSMQYKNNSERRLGGKVAFVLHWLLSLQNPQVPPWLFRGFLAYFKSYTAIRQKAAHFLELTRIQTRVTGRKIWNSSLVLTSARSARNGVEVIKNITAGLIKTGHLVSPHRTDRSRVQITPPWQVERCHTSQWSSINRGLRQLFHR